MQPADTDSHSNRPHFFPFRHPRRSRESSPSPRRSGIHTPLRTPTSSQCEMVDSHCSTPITSSTGFFLEVPDNSSTCHESINIPPHNISLRELIHESQSRVTTLNQQLTRLEQQTARCRKAEGNVCQQIVRQYDKYIQMIQDRKILALRKVKSLYSKVIQDISSQEKRFSKQAKSLKQAIQEATQERKIEIQVEKSTYEILDSVGDPLVIKLEEMRENFTSLLNESSDDYVITLPDVRFNIDKDIEYQLQRLGHVIIEVKAPPQEDPVKIKIDVQSPYGLSVGSDDQLQVLDWETNTLIVLNLSASHNTHVRCLGRTLARKSVHSVVGAPTGYYISFPNENAVKLVSIDLRSSVDVTGIQWYVFLRPHGLALTEKDNIVLADTNNNRVLVCSPDLNKVVLQIKSTEQGEGQLLHPREVAVTPAFDIVVLHEGYPCIHVYTPAGVLRFKFGSITTPARELDRPQSVAVSNDGDIFVGNVGFVGIYSVDGITMSRVWRPGVIQRLTVTSDRRVVFRGNSKDGIIIDSSF